MIKKMSRILFLIAMILPIQTVAQDGTVDVYRLTVLDCTGSMRSSFNEGTRFDASITRALEVITQEESFYDSLWKLQGSSSGVVVDFTKGSSSSIREILNDEDKRKAYELEPSGNTPLADTLCMAMDKLEEMGDSDDWRLLYFITDGEENKSGYYFGDIACSKNISDYPDNEYPFYVDGRKAFGWEEGDSTPSIDNSRDWITTNSTFPDLHDEETSSDYTGRVYLDVGQEDYYDWSGGVQPGSWEWKMYYRVAKGKNGIPDTSASASNDTWPNEEGNLPPPTDIIFNVTHFYDDIDEVTTNSLSLSLYKTAVLEEELEDDTVLMTTVSATTSSISTTAYSDTEIEGSLFSGLAQLTEGTYVSAVDGQDLPIIGDINVDGEVDETDLRIVLTWFGRATDVYNPQSIESDLFNEGFINNRDISVIRNNWTDSAKAAPIHGDIDYNWCVDEADLNQVMQWYGQAVNPGAQHSYHADMNADGVIDDEDVEIVEDHMYEGCLNR